MTLLSVEALEVSYGPVAALRGIDLEVAAGEIVGLVGANGAGKTTLLRTISGLVKPRAGRIRIEGQEIQAWASKRIVAAGIAHIPEGRRVWPEMTVEENLLLGGSVGAAEEPIARRLEEVVARFPELADRLGQKAGTLSGGEQQMLAIGRGLMSRPKLLMLDEPSLGLAPVVVDRVKGILESLNRGGLTVLLSEQNARLALGATHRTYVIAEGHVMSSGTPRELLKHADIISAYLGEGAQPDTSTNQGGGPRP
jgi:branched-chain amino acid transport system ATP-binding protein